MNKEIDISIIASIYILNDQMVRMTEDMMHDMNRSKTESSEFIIIDNASTHGIKEMEESADIYLRMDRNRGWGGGLNEGMKIAKGKYFIFANNDIRIEPGWIEKLIEKYESNLKIGTISINCRNGFSGALFGIRREIYELIGGFDEKNFPLGHAQDCDYLYRLMKEGWDDNVIIDPSFKHYVRRTYQQKDFREKYINHQNFNKSNFEKKWGFKEMEWEKRGHQDWTEKISKNPDLDRFNDLKNG